MTPLVRVQSFCVSMDGFGAGENQSLDAPFEHAVRAGDAFLDVSPAEALRQALGAAEGKDVRIGGGVATVRQFLEADLIDTLHVAVPLPSSPGAADHCAAPNPCKMAAVPFDPELADRIRTSLAAFEVREVAMFGGRSFMVHEHLAVAAASDGNLLLRCAPEQLERLLRRDGARPAEMRGKPMSPGWIRVDAAAVRDDGVLQQWIDVAVDHAESQAP